MVVIAWLEITDDYGRCGAWLAPPVSRQVNKQKTSQYRNTWVTSTKKSSVKYDVVRRRSTKPHAFILGDVYCACMFIIEILKEFSLKNLLGPSPFFGPSVSFQPQQIFHRKFRRPLTRYSSNDVVTGLNLCQPVCSPLRAYTVRLTPTTFLERKRMERSYSENKFEWTYAVWLSGSRWRGGLSSTVRSTGQMYGDDYFWVRYDLHVWKTYCGPCQDYTNHFWQCPGYRLNPSEEI